MDPFKNLHLDIPQTQKKRVVIIGGGFAGIQIAKGLKGHGFQVVLLDRNNYHTFQPLLYQVATAGLEPDSIAGALRQLFNNYPDFYFRMAKVTQIQPEEQKIHTLIGDLYYDYLVIANGSKTNYFGNQEMFNLTFPLKQIPQALNLRSQMLQNFEQTVLTRDPLEKDKLTNFVVVGGGPTGVEVSGALGELKKHVLPKDYPDIDFNIMNLHLVDAGPRLLAGMSEKASEKALKYLDAFDVKVKLNTFVKNYDGEEVTLSDGTVIPAKTVVWAAGVKGNIIDGIPESSLERGRILVDDFSAVKGIKNMFALGDIAFMKTDRYPNGQPMLAPVAIQQGKLLARNLIRQSKNEAMKPFDYVDKGSMATVGRNKAVVDMPKFTFGGFPAWLVWMFVHLLSIIGFRNRLVVFSNWVWNYFTYDRGTRLIIRTFVRNKNYKQGESL
ncbi:NADH dehydrogenase [Roseivirga ehrenbergii]|uniref:NADH:ubiquinone reductase (non-electrogenic) n=1 Tax=Roseivirga ehrenbergii (strain DSM 102268 / JCM 13514 / KCTC 12282 / NCIMB 14502 / KMM 6017) TaxID=279360 RepID=A0A150XRN4_ROSEK|nr:NAD(P)/FAD-dependent oxidoreductase [Roseivirga ehrenbergii]KYG81417.1 NADH dehydrogenase [Roseivirga ehrenbergii]TCL10566.1 NADH dehydrogenase [Roseivirga ehrenbergii]